MNDVAVATFEPPKNAGDAWRPLEHAELIEWLDSLIPDDRVSESYYLGNKNRNCYGVLRYRAPFTVFGMDAHLCVGFANHNDLRAPLKFYFGFDYTDERMERVSVVMTKVKGPPHRQGYDYKDTLPDIEFEYAVLPKAAKDFFNEQLTKPLTRNDLYAMIGRCCDAGAFPWTNSGKWFDKTIGYKERLDLQSVLYGYSHWSQRLSPTDQMARGVKAFNIFKNF